MPGRHIRLAVSTHTHKHIYLRAVAPLQLAETASDLHSLSNTHNTHTRLEVIAHLPPFQRIPHTHIQTSMHTQTRLEVSAHLPPLQRITHTHTHTQINTHIHTKQRAHTNKARGECTPPTFATNNIHTQIQTNTHRLEVSAHLPPLQRITHTHTNTNQHAQARGECTPPTFATNNTHTHKYKPTRTG